MWYLLTVATNIPKASRPWEMVEVGPYGFTSPAARDTWYKAFGIRFQTMRVKLRSTSPDSVCLTQVPRLETASKNSTNIQLPPTAISAVAIIRLSWDQWLASLA